MSDKVKSLDHVDTSLMHTNGWEISKVFAADDDDILKTHDEAMTYAEELAEQHDEVGFRPVIEHGKTYFDVYIYKKNTKRIVNRLTISMSTQSLNVLFLTKLTCPNHHRIAMN